MSDSNSLPAAPTKIVAGSLTNEQRAALMREANERRAREDHVAKKRQTIEGERKKRLVAAHTALARAIEHDNPAEVLAATEEVRNAEKIGTLRSHLASIRYKESTVDDEPKPLIWLCNVPVASEGNLVVLSAQAKGGKTSSMSGLIAAAVSGDQGAADLLGWRTNNRGLAVVHIDTEQSRAHHTQFCKRAKRRANLPAMPDWYYSYPLAGWSAQDIRESIDIVCAEAELACGGIHTVVIDGIGDAVIDVNNAGECMPLISHLHGLAMRYRCAIVLVIHRNPGKASDGKTRGHLGSQSERKAESNLTIDFDEASRTSIIYGLRMRGQPILKRDGLKFAWNDTLKMHETVPSTATQRKDPLEEIIAVLAEAGKPKTAAEILNLLLMKGGRSSIPTVNRYLQAGIMRQAVEVVPLTYPKAYTLPIK